MNLIPWRNKEREEDGGTALAQWRPFEDFHSQLDRLFNRFMGDDWGQPASNGWGPAIDVTEDDKSVTLKAELPGVDPKDIDVSVTGNMLTISGEKKEEHEKKGKGFYHRERRMGSFQRSVQLPAYVKSEAADAEYKNGILTIRLDKDESAQSKRVPVKSA